MSTWRVGSHYGIHVYEDETPIATFHTAAGARQAVEDHNELARLRSEVATLNGRLEVATRELTDTRRILDGDEINAVPTLALMAEHRMAALARVTAMPDARTAPVGSEHFRHGYDCGWEDAASWVRAAVGTTPEPKASIEEKAADS